MKKTSHQTHWLVDLALLAGYLLSFYLELTGVNLHQWLGVGVTALALIHLILHWDWVTAVVKRFFGKTSGRSRIYLLLDLLIMFGAVVIFETGLVISTWFSLNLYNYAAWLDVHIYSAVITLSITVLKLGFHWRWIVCNAKKIFARRETIRTPQPLSPDRVPVPVNLKSVDRRHFLMLMGAVGAASALAASNVFSKMKDVQSAAVTQEAAASPQAAIAQSTATTGPATSLQSSKTPTPDATAVPTAAYANPVASCTVRCPRGCSYPGHCSRYTDCNQNNRCDLGECL
jgi:hypothetical protein